MESSQILILVTVFVYLVGMLLIGVYFSRRGGSAAAGEQRKRQYGRNGQRDNSLCFHNCILLFQITSYPSVRRKHTASR